MRGFFASGLAWGRARQEAEGFGGVGGVGWREGGWGGGGWGVGGRETWRGRECGVRVTGGRCDVWGGDTMWSRSGDGGGGGVLWARVGGRGLSSSAMLGRGEVGGVGRAVVGVLDVMCGGLAETAGGGRETREREGGGARIFSGWGGSSLENRGRSGWGVRWVCGSKEDKGGTGTRTSAVGCSRKYGGLHRSYQAL